MLTKSKRELTELQSLHTGQSIERIEVDQDRDQLVHRARRHSNTASSTR